MRRFTDVASGVAYRGLKKIATNPQLLIPSLLFPLFFFTAFAGGLSSVGARDGRARRNAGRDRLPDLRRLLLLFGRVAAPVA